MMKWIMTGMIALSIVFAALGDRMEELSSAFLEECGNAVTLALTLTGIIALWSGLMRVAQSSGLTGKLAKAVSPLLSRLFGGLDRGGKAMQYITLNITANVLGLGNASTPFGIAAMREIEREEKSDEPDVASDNMILLAVMNTASLQLIPTTAAALRLSHGSKAPMEILPCVWIASVSALAAALTAAFTLRRLRKRRLP
ncbi:MAG: spore maturation protein A [Ruminiclostridium sp.]|nr:spore maturation protein A [Ruminiclostridium sp.]